MRVAYLVNQYPSLSHTFIRREILALERLDVVISRFSIRSTNEIFAEAQDETEAKLTFSILGSPKKMLLASVLITIVSQPAAAFWKIWVSWRMVRGGERRWIRTVACWIEACWLARRLRAAKIEHLHAHFGTNSAAVARLAADLAHINYSFTIHGPEEFDNVDALDLAGKVADAAFTVAVSGFGRSQVCRAVPMEIWPRVHIVRCGLDLSVLDAPLGTEGEAIDVCFVGRLAPQKGLPTLLEAIALLHGRGIPVRTLIIGSGELKKKLHDYCLAAGIEAIVHFAGPRNGEGVAAAMAAAKIVAVPSFAEGLPVVIMEAFAAGTPVISTYIAGIPELVDTTCGALVVAGDAPALAEAIMQLLDAGPERRQEMGAAGRIRVIENHDIDSSARQLKALFEHYGRSGR